MAVLADAFHDLGDTVSLGVAWRLSRLSTGRGDEVFSYGYRRFTLLGALLVAVVLVVGGVIVLARAIPRLVAPSPSTRRGWSGSLSSASW